MIIRCLFQPSSKSIDSPRFCAQPLETFSWGLSVNLVNETKTIIADFKSFECVNQLSIFSHRSHHHGLPHVTQLRPCITVSRPQAQVAPSAQ